MKYIRRRIASDKGLFERTSLVGLTPTICPTLSICRINSSIARLLLTNRYLNNSIYYCSVTRLLLANSYLNNSIYYCPVTRLLLTNRYL